MALIAVEDALVNEALRLNPKRSIEEVVRQSVEFYIGQFKIRELRGCLNEEDLWEEYRTPVEVGT